MTDEELKCMEAYKKDCEGPVEYRESMTGTGTPMKRCDHHHAVAIRRQQDIQQRYPASPPADFDPSYAGESWDEPY